MMNRSKFLRLLWRQRKSEFTTALGSDGCDYIVPTPRRGAAQPPRIPTAYRGDDHAKAQ